jgi:PHD/YefM family antitoxin component YafN of YafNO toxin-antitoxin module
MNKSKGETPMRTISTDYFRKHLDLLLDEITEINEPVRIEGDRQKAVVLVKAEDFEKFFRFDERKPSASPIEKSAKSLFGMLRHRAKAVPVSVEEMETVIKKRRYERAVK